jgi:hypothetical protein
LKQRKLTQEQADRLNRQLDQKNNDCLDFSPVERIFLINKKPVKLPKEIGKQMSAESQKTVKEIQETFRKITKEADDAGKKAGNFGDKELTTKIKRLKEDAGSIVKHIEERSK